MDYAAFVSNRLSSKILCGRSSHRECVEACPVRTFTGVRFDRSELRDVRFRAHLRNDYSERRGQFLGEGLCDLCVYICPYGRRGTRLAERLHK